MLIREHAMKTKKTVNAKKQTIKIIPSILSADFSNLQKDVDKVKNADWLQIDVMDGHFVNNITFGPIVMKGIKTKLKLDVHLMIENPEKFLKQFVDAGAYSITFHIEASKNPLKIISTIKKLNAGAGIAINPETPASKIKKLLPYLDQVIVMTVNPGFGGQKFLSSCLSKVKEIRKSFAGDIEVDGGINEKTIALAAKAGANAFVAGSYVFKSSSPSKRVELLRKTAQKYY